MCIYEGRGRWDRQCHNEPLVTTPYLTCIPNKSALHKLKYPPKSNEYIAASDLRYSASIVMTVSTSMRFSATVKASE